MLIAAPSVTLMSHTINSELLLEQAGRTCYRSDLVKCLKCGGKGDIDQDIDHTDIREVGLPLSIPCEACGGKGFFDRDYVTEPDPESSAKFVNRILKRGHEAVIEHAYVTIRFVTDRGVTHEMVRHRIGSYCQESTRYCNYGGTKFGNEITVVIPPGMNAEQTEEWKEAMLFAEDKYLNMLKAGASPQIARSVLPNSLKTEIVTTFNLREWRHFFRLRMSKYAHPQIRQCAAMSLPIMQAIAPTLFGSNANLPEGEEAEAWFAEMYEGVRNDEKIPGWFNSNVQSVAPFEGIIFQGSAEWDYALNSAA